jgi:phage-related protein
VADVAFTFDPSQVIGGVDKINAKMGQMAGNFQKAAGQTAKAVQRGMMKAALLIGGLVAAFKGTVSVIKQYAPEIGEAFNIAKDVFFKNFLWPIRKELMPLLQRMLDWVRKNRARFVQWGQAVANAFKVIVTIAKQVIDWGKQMIRTMAQIFRVLFGDQVRTIEDAWNLLIAKISTVAIFISHLMGSVLSLVGEFINRFGPQLVNIFKGALETVLAFFDGFIRGAAGIKEPLMEIFQSVVDFVEDLFSPNRFGDRLQDVFATIGETIGFLFERVARIVNAFIGPFLDKMRDVATPLRVMADAIQGLFERLLDEEAMGGLEKFFGFLGKITGTAVLVGLQMLATYVTFLADAIVLMVNALRDLFTVEGGNAIEKLGNIFSGRAFDRTRESGGELFSNVNENTGIIGDMLGFGGGRGDTNVTLDSTVTINPPPGTSPEAIANMVAETEAEKLRLMLDAEDRGLGR